MDALHMGKKMKLVELGSTQFTINFQPFCFFLRNAFQYFGSNFEAIID